MKNIKSTYHNNKFKIYAAAMINLIYLMDHILFQTFNIILNVLLKNKRL